LWNAVDQERRRPIAWAGTTETGAEPADSAEPPVFSRVALPAGDALVGWSGDVWAALLDPSDPALSVAVMIVGRGVVAARTPGVKHRVPGCSHDRERERHRPLR
jgi:hypothetical protein